MGVALGLRRMGVRRGVVGALVVGSSSVCPDEGIACWPVSLGFVRSSGMLWRVLGIDQEIRREIKPWGHKTEVPLATKK